MIKIAFFDLDGTLCEVGKPSADETVSELGRLSEKGVKIAVCSGKPVAYLNGYARQIGIDDIILIGETGAEWQIGVGLPPISYGEFPYNEKAKASRAVISEEFEKRFHGMYWLQPNRHEFTVFPKEERFFPEMREFFDRVIPGSGLDIYCQPDCFDVLPHGINKGEAVKHICGVLDIDVRDACAVGDGINDFSMWDVCGTNISVNAVYDCENFTCVNTPCEAIKEIIRINENK